MTNRFVFQMDADEGEVHKTIIVTAYLDEVNDILIGEELIELTIDKELAELQ